MLQQVKSGKAKFALMVTLAASAIAVGNAQAQDVTIPIPATDPEIQAVVQAVKGDSMVKDVMNAKRAAVILEQAAQMPLIDQVMTQMQPMMKAKIINTQMDALKDPSGGIPGSIAPPPF
jgi:hypothetical protein